MDRRTARKGEVEARLAEPDIYAEANKDELKRLMLEQATLSKDLEALEADWLTEQEALEALEA